MTSTLFTSEQNETRRNRKSFIATSQLIYQVTVYGEENETETFEVMADDYAGAAAQAQNIAYDRMIDIAYIDIECMG